MNIDEILNEPISISPGALTYGNIYDFKSEKNNYNDWIEHVMEESMPFSMKDLYIQQLEMVLNELKIRYRFETEGWNEKFRYITFSRTERKDIHKVTIEDDRDDDEIQDWLIFSCLANDEDEPYALTWGEFHLFERLIRILQHVYTLDDN